ncbi:hypothetical protein ACIHEI_25470 [Kitasatospora sp. NPDC051984]|uniref:hypothetical protein n=1 Tax=Kitasatospora sp. NPDC051984 TaxID=3364059 RepID=UPI0037C6C446
MAAYQLAQQALAADFAARWAEVLATVEAREVASSLAELSTRYAAAVREYAATSRVLSIAFYRLVRALETGRVIGGPGYRPGGLARLPVGRLQQGDGQADRLRPLDASAREHPQPLPCRQPQA